jgi:hypothetical protein
MRKIEIKGNPTKYFGFQRSEEFLQTINGPLAGILEALFWIFVATLFSCMII